MKIKDIELKSGIDRATIYYYEKEGLLTPLRKDNGYRKYTEDDFKDLQKIKLLRSLHLPIGEIKSLIREENNLREILSNQMTRLDKEEENIDYAKIICRRIYDEESSFSTLDTEKYLNQVHIKNKEEGNTYFKVQDEIPQVFDPIRRFLARFTDILLYAFLWNIILSLFGRDILDRGIMEQLLDVIAILFLILLLEPISIWLFKTTFGKAIFGMTIKNSEGERLTLDKSFNRTLGVITKGLALGLPLINLITLSVSYDRCKRGEIQPWDENVAYQIKDYKYYRYGVMALSVLVFFSIELLLSLNYYMPPYDGNITVEEYVENFRHYQEIYDIDLAYKLKSSGAWEEADYDYKKSYLPHHLRSIPTLKYTLDQGIVKGVSFDVRVENSEFYIESYQDLMLLISLALMSPSNIIEGTTEMDSIYNKITIEPFKPFNIDAVGILIENNIEYEGFEESFDLIEPASESEKNYYIQEFSVSKK